MGSSWNGRGGARSPLARVSAVAAGVIALAATVPAFAADLVGQPTDGAIDLQPSVTPLRSSAAYFHNWIMLPVLSAVCLFVLGLLIYVVFRFNSKANPTPARFTHNTPIEIVWTAAPVLILMFFSIFSFRLLYNYHDVPKPDLTIKVTGNQWYWNYEYPTAGDFAFDSIPLTEPKAAAAGKPYRLGVDNPMVVPVNKNVQILATGADVLHSFFVPALGVQTTTIPGRVNQTWFRAEREGVIYGQCNELCGINHSFMPIEVDVVSQAKYDSWVAAHAKKTTAVAAADTGASPATKAVAAQGAPAAGAAHDSAAGVVVGPVTGAPPAPAAAGKPPAAQTGPRGKARVKGAPAPAGANGASPAQ